MMKTILKYLLAVPTLSGCAMSAPKGPAPLLTNGSNMPANHKAEFLAAVGASSFGASVFKMAAPGNDMVLATNSSGNLVPVTKASLGGGGGGGDLTSGPVRSSGGVSSIADDALSIAKTNGLQSALDARAPLVGNSTFTGNNIFNGITTVRSDAATALRVRTTANTTLLQVDGTTGITEIGSLNVAGSSTFNGSAVFAGGINGVLVPQTNAVYDLGITNLRWRDGYLSRNLAVGGTIAATGTVTGSNFTGSSSGTNTGDQTTITGNAGSATILQTGRTLGITGDLTWTSPTFNGSGNVSAAGTLATVNGNTGTFGSASVIPVFTVNGKGLITGVSGAGVAAPAASITGSTLAPGVTSSSLTSVGTLTSLSVGGPITEGVVALGTVTTTSTISLAAGTVVTGTLTASTACTFTMPAVTAGRSFSLYLKQAASTGNGSATFTGVKWSGGTAPVITATAGRMDILSFVSDGTNWYGSYVQNFTP